MQDHDRQTILPLCVRAVLLLGAAILVGFMLFAGEPASPVWWLGFAAFALWGLVPFAAVASATNRHLTHPRALWVLLTAAFVLGVSNAGVFYDAFIAHPDAQSGILFVVLPIWQLIVLLPFLALARFLSRESK